MIRVILHLDMDAFYASIEQRDHAALRGRPVIVGSPPEHRGVVCAASYEARKFGVRSAMPSSVAKRLCPEGAFIVPRMETYRSESEKIMEIVAGTGALVERISIDEAYLDISALCQVSDADESLYRALPFARRLKEEIFTRRALTTSIGIGGNKLLAKLASDFGKPNGLILIPERDKVLFLRPLPIRALHGVGKVTEKLLLDAGILTVGDLQDYPGDVAEFLGSFGVILRKYTFGEDDQPLQFDEQPKSISSETTFAHDTTDREFLRACLREQAAEIAFKLSEKGLCAQTIQVKVRYADFTTLTRQVTTGQTVTEARDIFRLGCYLLGRHRLVCRPLRLIGLGASKLLETVHRQLELPWR